VKSKDSQLNVKKSSTASLSLYKLALLIGVVGLGFSVFSAYIYYVHILCLPETSIEAVRYMASTHSAAVTLFALSISLGLIALLKGGCKLSFRLMLASTATAIVGYMPPIERLWRLGYARSLSETMAIAVVHTVLLATSAALLYRASREKAVG
jgi:hypothetical protein